MKLTQDKKRGIIATIVFHLVVLILFSIFGFTIPLPFPPEELGLPVQLALGNTDFGSGDVRPESTAPEDITDPVSIPEEVVSSSAPEEVATQDQESDISIPQATSEKPAEKPREFDSRLKNVLQSNPFQTDKNNPSQGQGATDEPGTFGKRNGSPDGNSNIGDPRGGGNGHNLAGRTASIGKVPGNWQEEGIIKVEVFVDRSGKVLRAREAQGTTIVNASLVKATVEEAKKVKFSANNDAPVEQRGIITYQFVLQ